MTTKKLYGKDLKVYQDIDLDELLAKLTDAELEELHTELIDPDDSMVPPSDRCRYKTDKLPTGPFERKKLLEFLERKAREDKDWDEAKPFKKETRGKVWKAKDEDKIQINDDVQVETEWDEVLATATEAELVDLAAILGFHGMLNQVQYHQAFVECKGQDESAAGFQGVAKYAEFKLFEDLPPNTTDVEASIAQLKANDPKLKELNLNNMKKIPIETLCEIAEALSTNTSLEKLYMANTRATDRVARAIAESLEKNKTLKALNLESNYISGLGIIGILEAINITQVLTELKVANQRPQVLGVRNEMTIAKCLRDNQSIIRFGIFMEIRCPRILVTEYVQRNYDNLRRERAGKEIVLPPVEETPYYLKKKPGTEDAKEDGKDKKAEPVKKAEATKKTEAAKKTEPAAKVPPPGAKKAPEPPKKTPEPARKVPPPAAAKKAPEPPKKTPEPAKKAPEPPKKTPEPARKVPPPAAAKKAPEPPKKTSEPAKKAPEPPKKTPEPPKKTPEPAKKPPPPESSSSEEESSEEESDSDEE